MVGNEKKKSGAATNLLFLDWADEHAIHHEHASGLNFCFKAWNYCRNSRRSGAVALSQLHPIPYEQMFLSTSIHFVFFSPVQGHIISTSLFSNHNGETRNVIYKFGSRLSSPEKWLIPPSLLIYII